MSVINEDCVSCIIAKCRLITGHNRHNYRDENDYRSVTYRTTRPVSMSQLIYRAGGAALGSHFDQEPVGANAFKLTSIHAPHTPSVTIAPVFPKGATVTIESNTRNDPSLLPPD